MKKLIPIFLTLVVLAACDQEEPPTPSEILTTPASGWKYKEFTITSGSITIDYMTAAEACDIDELIVFLADATYRVENPVKCESTEPSVHETGTWSLSNDSKKLTYQPTGDDPYVMDIVEIVPGQVKVTMTIEVNGSTATARITVVPK